MIVVIIIVVIIIAVILLIVAILFPFYYPKKQEERNTPPVYKKKKKKQKTYWVKDVTIPDTDSVDYFKKGGKIKKSPSKITKNYDDLLQREEWLKKRKEILTRDNYECCRCHKKNVQLNVHHKYYLKDKNGNPVDPWDYPNSALITLCRDCHKLVHQNTKIKWFYKFK